MTEITLFDKIKYGNCKTHPHDVIVILSDKKYGVYYENYNDDADHDTLREVVESQDCNWFWYCDYYECNPLDEKWGRYE